MSFEKKKLKKNQLESILWYSQEGYELVNKKRSKLSEEDIEEIDDYLPTLLNLFEVVKPIEDTITVYRGVDVNNTDEIKTFKKGITSTSYSIENALNFVENNCCILKITIPSGSKILDIGNVSYFPEEEEVLINNAFGTLKIIDFSKYKNKIDVVNVVYIPHDTMMLTVKNLKI